MSIILWTIAIWAGSTFASAAIIAALFFFVSDKTDMSEDDKTSLLVILLAGPVGLAILVMMITVITVLDVSRKGLDRGVEKLIKLKTARAEKQETAE